MDFTLHICISCTYMKPTEIRYIINYWLPVVVIMAFISWMSSGTFSADNTSRFIVPILRFFFPDITPVRINLIHVLIRKSAHFSEYFILSVLLFRAFRGNLSRRWSLRWTILALIISALFAMLDEFHQSFIAYRTSSLFDVIIDILGSFTAQLMIAGRGLIVRTGREFSR